MPTTCSAVLPVLLAVAVGCRKKAGPNPERAPAAPPSLDGTYRLVTMKQSGSDFVEKFVARWPEEMRPVVIHGDAYTCIGTAGLPIEDRIKTDPSTDPPEIDIT